MDKPPANLAEVPPSGFAVVRVDEDWTLGPHGRCRFMVPSRNRWPMRSCGQPTVASFIRGSRRRTRWGYCERHIAHYGRVIRYAGAADHIVGEVWWDPVAAEEVRATFGDA